MAVIVWSRQTKTRQWFFDVIHGSRTVAVARLLDRLDCHHVGDVTGRLIILKRHLFFLFCPHDGSTAHSFAFPLGRSIIRLSSEALDCSFDRSHNQSAAQSIGQRIEMCKFEKCKSSTISNCKHGEGVVRRACEVASVPPVASMVRDNEGWNMLP